MARHQAVLDGLRTPHAAPRMMLLDSGWGFGSGGGGVSGGVDGGGGAGGLLRGAGAGSGASGAGRIARGVVVLRVWTARWLEDAVMDV